MLFTSTVCSDLRNKFLGEDCDGAFHWLERLSELDSNNIRETFFFMNKLNKLQHLVAR